MIGTFPRAGKLHICKSTSEPFSEGARRRLRHMLSNNKMLKREHRDPNNQTCPEESFVLAQFRAHIPEGRVTTCLIFSFISSMNRSVKMSSGSLINEE